MAEKQEIEELLETIKSVSDYDFSDYSVKSFTRRAEKLLTDYKLTFPSLITKIKTEKGFIEQIIKDVTVNTTELFRDPKIWQAIRSRLLNKFTDSEEINIWHAGCSTGQEVYSMMILLNELGLLNKSNIFATDINTDVIEIAKKGVYNFHFNVEYLQNFKEVICENPLNFEEYNDVPFSKYFIADPITDTISMNQFLKNKPYYRKHDMVKEGNVFYRKFDIIICRNVLIYFNTNLQNRLFSMFNEALQKKGTLILGAHESILGIEGSKYIKHSYFYLKK